MSVPPARTLLAGLHLLDRQLIDRDDRLAGKVDDVELRRDDATGHLVVTALLSGRGALWRRLGAHRLAAWLEALPPGGGEATGDDAVQLARGYIPMARVVEIGPAIRVAADAGELATAAGERWARRHVIGHLPGNRDVVE
jgi:hypothetical protein